MRLQIVPLTFGEACAFVAQHQRHHIPPVGHKFSIGVADGDRVVGVAMVGRPVCECSIRKVYGDIAQQVVEVSAMPGERA